MARIRGFRRTVLGREADGTAEIGPHSGDQELEAELAEAEEASEPPPPACAE
ncbi:hypothetical protein [Streptomyces rimosus]|uniref:hypothetical protein n=1 Tax=Streptomyces rimosus TaxID=1927 RepID=UPI00131E47DE|nr:hypothetical protein [Streptomyces rimosus]